MKSENVLPATIVVLGLLVLVLELAAEHRTCYGAHDAVATKLVAAEVASGAATKGTHEAAITLGLRVGVCGAILLLAGLPVS